MLKSEIELTTWWHCVPCDFAFRKGLPHPQTKGYNHFSPSFDWTDMSGDIIKKKKKKKI